MSQHDLYIGLMSGTSADGIDAALVDFSDETPRIIATHSQAYEPKFQERIADLCTPGDNEIDRLGALDRELGELFAHAVLGLLDSSGTQPDQVTAIGSHGQTVRHRPPNPQAYGSNPSDTPFSLQIADPNIICQRTGITTIADFRRRDMAAGGQGAPLMPAFHGYTFRSDKSHRAVINIGGIANVTWVGADGSICGFDTGPGNTLMDQWVQLQHGKPYDDNGAWAASGQVDNTLLDTLLAHPYFSAEAPKSTGREEFNLDWLNSQLKLLSTQPSAVDVQATLLELSARTISTAIRNSNVPTFEVFLCGGGALNHQLTARLEAMLHPAMVCSTDILGMHPQWVEAAGFAWLAYRTFNRMNGNLTAVTGASEEVILGGVYFA